MYETHGDTCFLLGHSPFFLHFGLLLRLNLRLFLPSFRFHPPLLLRRLTLPLLIQRLDLLVGSLKRLKANVA